MNLFQLQGLLLQHVPQGTSTQKTAQSLALTFAASAGAMTEAKCRIDNAAYQKAFGDLFVSVLLSANMLNLNLAKRVGMLGSKSKLDDNERIWVSVGKMAKACEALDHVEDYPSRAIMEQSTIDLCRILVNKAKTDGTDLEAIVSTYIQKLVPRPVSP